jgi:hypothetical protein
MSLGIYIRIERTENLTDTAIYEYAVGDGAEGTIVVSKETGDVSLVRPCEGETADQMMFYRAAAKLRKHWRAGDLPQKTWWAA